MKLSQMNEKQLRKVLSEAKKQLNNKKKLNVNEGLYDVYDNVYEIYAQFKLPQFISTGGDDYPDVIKDLKSVFNKIGVNNVGMEPIWVNDNDLMIFIYQSDNKSHYNYLKRLKSEEEKIFNES